MCENGALYLALKILSSRIIPLLHSSNFSHDSTPEITRRKQGPRQSRLRLQRLFDLTSPRTAIDYVFARNRNVTVVAIRAKPIIESSNGVPDTPLDPIIANPLSTPNAHAPAASRAMKVERQTNGESEGEGRTIVLVKPQTIGLRTNIVLITDRRTYTIEASSSAGAAYSAQIAWSYPAIQGEAGAAIARPMNENYRVRTVRGMRPSWLPTRVYDDGRRTWLEFPESVGSADMPPLFVITPEGAELVNYRVQGRRYMIDRIFDVAELRFGTRAPIVVRIERRASRTGQGARS